MTLPHTSAAPLNSGFSAQCRAWIGGAVEVLRGEDDRARTQRDVLLAFAVRVASAAILYLSQVVLARWMGSFEYGIYVFVWTWVLVLGGLSHGGLSMAMIRLLPEYKEKGELDLLRGLMFGGRIAAVVLATIVACLGGITLWLLGAKIASPYVWPAYLALVCLPMYTLTDVQDGIGRGQRWMAVALVPPYVLRPLLVLAAMFAAHELGMPMDARTAAAAAVVATWGAAVAQIMLVRRARVAEIPTGAEAYDFPTWFRTARPLLVIGGCDIVLQNVDVIAISRFMTPTDVGIYYAAAKTMSLVMFVHYAVGSAVANRFSSLHARGDRAGLEAFVRDAVNWTFWPSLAAAIVILALGRPLLWLFGPQFLAGYPVMFVLVLGFLARAAMGPSDFLLNMLGEQRACAMILAATAVLDIVLNFTLVPIYGLMGAASATAISLTFASVLNYVVARRRLNLDVGIWSNLGGAPAKPAPKSQPVTHD
jgi:O-antigen/teichoic acid export membrane protein